MVESLVQCYESLYFRKTNNDPFDFEPNTFLN